LTGKGVRADLNGETYFAGKPALFEELGLAFDSDRTVSDGGVAVEDAGGDDLAAASAETIEALQAAGEDGHSCRHQERILGVVAVADEIRPEAKQTVERLHELGVKRIVMLTGDNEVTARAVGEMAGVDEVRAELLPSRRKAETVAALDEEFGGVMMVGDGDR